MRGKRDGRLRIHFAKAVGRAAVAESAQSETAGAEARTPARQRMQGAL
jgi:hypothetical protein